MSVELQCQSPELLELPEMISEEHKKRWTQLYVNDEGGVREKIWLCEEAIETYHEAQLKSYFLVRLALLLPPMGAESLGLHLLRQAQALLLSIGIVDQGLDSYIDEVTPAIDAAAEGVFERSRAIYYHQPWRETREHRFPTSLPFPPPDAQEVRDRWQHLAIPGSDFLKTYMRKLAIETNHVENTFRLTEESNQDLARRALCDGEVHCHMFSEIQDEQAIRVILQETLEAYELVKPLVDNPSAMDYDAICRMHAQIMKTAAFYGPRYPPPGKTRTITRKTVTMSGPYTVEFCPYEKVDRELDYICRMAKQWIRSWRNPFATASWIHMIFAECHPFDDGNGRLTRILASIPLISAGYPPISLGLNRSPEYYSAIRKAYEGDHSFWVQCVLEGMKEMVRKVESIVEES